MNLAETLGVQEDHGRLLDRSLDTARDNSHSYADREYLRREQERVSDEIRALERQGEEADQRERLRRVMSRLSRLDDNTSSSNTAAYGDRVPSQNSLYDWSPANEADGEDELDHILAELRREQPNTHPEILRVLGRSQLDSERERIRSIANRLNSERAGSGESLRSTAILQSVRRHPRFSARTRDYLQRYNTDRDRDRERERERENRMSQRSESQQRFLDESNRRAAMQRLQESRNNALDRERRDMLSRADTAGLSYRRSYLDHRTSTPTPAVSPLLEQTVKYLSRIRHSESIDDSVSHALDGGVLSKDYLGDCTRNYSDFVLDVSTIPPPAQTSWLAPGAVLSGDQHATSVAATSAPVTHPNQQYQTYNSHSRTAVAAAAAISGLMPPTRPWLANSYNTPRSRTAQLSELAPPPQQDRWPVKVTIHEVDWANMTLSATMEAYNVPSHPHALPSHQHQQHYTRTSSITTYLEGEILDYTHHTLLTESFKSNAGTDATYWRKLPPFSGMGDEELVRALTSKRWHREVLGKEWVLMRWKERCFVKALKNSSASSSPPITTSTHNNNPIPSYHSHLHPDFLHPDGQHATFDDSGCGLTISGFYYVVMRRSDGGCEGLYFDPQSSPYQCLRLESRRGGVRGAWGFR